MFNKRYRKKNYAEKVSILWWS